MLVKSSLFKFFILKVVELLIKITAEKSGGADFGAEVF